MNHIAQKSKQAISPKRQKSEVYRSEPKLTKKPPSRIPTPQFERIMQRYAAGQSIREISRKEQRARQTVVRVIRSDEMEAYIRTMRERLYGLGSLAVDTIQRTLQRRKDAQLAYRLLIDIGVVPNLEQRHLITTQTALTALNGTYSPAMMALAHALYEKAKLFKLPLPKVLADGEGC
jgi:hypothetical protein